MSDAQYPTLAPILQQMLEHQASDAYLTHGCPPSLRLSDRIVPLGSEACNDSSISAYLDELLNDEQREEFDATLELNTSFAWQSNSRFRVNLYKQQQHSCIVLRRINTQIPTLEELGLPQPYADAIMQPRGLILLVGQTGSGKSTSLAAMIGHRNRHGTGHIITIEDPIEYVHQHEGCIISQRDVGIDTYSYGIALKNALRQRPDIVLIGEIRDRETMEHAINFAQTGHLCLATLHANNSNQAIERITNLFPEEKHQQVLMNLALNLRAIFSQRLLLNVQGQRSLVTEIMLNSGLIRTLIEEGKVREMKEMIEKGGQQGMQSFDQSILALHKQGVISAEVAVAESDNAPNMRLHINQSEVAQRIQQQGNSQHLAHLQRNIKDKSNFDL